MAYLSESGGVTSCSVSACSFNAGQHCMAPSVYIGQDHHECDSFTTDEVAKGVMNGFVLQCDAGECAHNKAHRCFATGIALDSHDDHADCVTYAPKI